MIAAIEIGGTKIQLAVASPTDPTTLHDLIRFRVDRSQGAEGIRQQIVEGMRRLSSRHTIERIGIGFGGPFDPWTGRVVTSHQVKGWDNFPLIDWCARQWSVSAMAANDCNVAALAEATLGAGRGKIRVFYVTVGTGIGGGMVVDGRIEGHDRVAVAEIGHLRPGLQATGAGDTVESRSAGLGIEAAMQRALENPAAWGGNEDDANDFRSRWHPDDRPLGVPEIAQAAAHGHSLAKSVIDQATETLGWALGQVTTLMAPDMIVVGGGVSLIGETFLDGVRRAWQTYVFPPLKENCDIVRASLGEQVVLHGAILLASASL